MSRKKSVTRVKSKNETGRNKARRTAAPKPVKATAQKAAQIPHAPPSFKGFYKHTEVASLVTALLLNATEDKTTFTDVGAQLNAAIEMAKESSQLNNAKDYLEKVTVLRDFWCKSNANKALLVKAHLAIADWLYAVIEQYPSAWADNCFHVGHDTIKGIFSLNKS